MKNRNLPVISETIWKAGKRGAQAFTHPTSLEGQHFSRVPLLPSILSIMSTHPQALAPISVKTMVGPMVLHWMLYLDHSAAITCGPAGARVVS